MSEPQLTTRRIARFWAPLAATWLMMAAEGPLVSALIARLAEPEYHLAAYGVTLALAMFIEAPVVMFLSAANALVAGSGSLRALRRFATRLNVAVTLAMVALLVPPLYRVIAGAVLGLDEPVARRAYLGLALMVLWPAAIGYRRFYQGILIREGRPRRVAFGSLIRLGTMAAVGGTLFASRRVPGIAVGAAALASGVLAEAVASRLMARSLVRRLRRTPDPPGAVLDGRAIAAFYTPLALTSLLSFGIHPLTTFFLGRSREPLVALAVMPVIIAYTFIFRSGGFAFQETAIALLDSSGGSRRALARFTALLAAALSGLLALTALTPLAALWFTRAAGLSPELAAATVVPVRLLAVHPALEVLLAWQRARLVRAGRTAPITVATALEVAGIVATLAFGIGPLDLPGATAAAAGLVAGRTAANAFLALRLARPL